MKCQDLLKEGRNGLNAFGTGAKIHFREKKYLGARAHSRKRQTRISSFSVYIYLDGRNLSNNIRQDTSIKGNVISHLWKRNQVDTRSDNKARPLEMKRVRQPAKLLLIYVFYNEKGNDQCNSIYLEF